MPTILASRSFCVRIKVTADVRPLKSSTSFKRLAFLAVKKPIVALVPLRVLKNVSAIPLDETEREFRARLGRLERATGGVVDLSVSFQAHF
jgi:hypothetical protein